MEAFMQALRSRMQEELNKLDPKAVSVHYFSDCVKIIRAAIMEIKQFIRGYRFKDQDEEIKYYKELTPFFLSNRLYYSAVYDMEVEKARLRQTPFCFLLEAELAQIDRYYEKYRWLYEYRIKNEKISDSVLFTRNAILNEALDESCFTTYSYELAKIMSYERYRQYIEQELYKQKHPPGTSPEEKKPFGKWVASKSAVVELMECIQLSEAIEIDGHKASLAELVEQVEGLLDVDLKDFNNLDYANRSRKKDLTPFMNSMMEKYKDRAIRLNK